MESGGVTEGTVYDNYEECDFNIDELRKKCISIFGLDFGYSADPTALVCGFVDTQNKVLYIYDEIYKRGLLNNEIYNEINYRGYSKEVIIADCAEPKSIEELHKLGLRRIKPAQKGKDSISNGIQNIQQYKMKIRPCCVNFLTEIQNYTWAKDKFGNTLNKPVDEFNHLMDALRYGMERLKQGDSVTFSDNKIL